MDVFSLQLILGTDKKNPTFSIYRNAKNPGFIYVYVGLALVEIVKDDPRSLVLLWLKRRLKTLKLRTSYRLW